MQTGGSRIFPLYKYIELLVRIVKMGGGVGVGEEFSYYEEKNKFVTKSGYTALKRLESIKNGNKLNFFAPLL